MDFTYNMTSNVISVTSVLCITIVLNLLFFETQSVDHTIQLHLL